MEKYHGLETWSFKVTRVWKFTSFDRSHNDFLLVFTSNYRLYFPTFLMYLIAKNTASLKSGSGVTHSYRDWYHWIACNACKSIARYI